MAIAVLSGVAIGGLSWRLAQGPLDLPWLTKRVEAALNQDETSGHIAITSAALAWEGFRLGVDRPLDIRLRDVSFADATGKQILTVPSAEISLSLHWLLVGRIALRALEIDQARISLVRAADGTIVMAPEAATETSPGPQPLLALLSELGRPPATDRNTRRANPLSQLRRVRIHDAALDLVDQQLGVTWRAPHMDIDLTRRSEGGVDASASLSLALGERQAQITATATLPPGKGPISARARVSSIEPAALARLLPSATWLADIAAPVSAEADLHLDEAMALENLHLTLQAGAGSIHVAEGTLPISRASVVADVRHDQVALHSLRLELPSHPGAPPSVVQATGQLERAPDHLTAAISVALNQVDFGDLPRLWPLGVGHGARAWITENVTAGVAHDGHVELGLEATPDLSSVTLTRATGSLAGEGLRVSWLAPVPPIDQGTAILNILNPDTLEIVVQSGHQQPEKGTQATNGGLRIRSGSMRITGIMQPHQFGAIEADIEGPLPDAIALLRDPRLRLLDRHKLPLNDPAGEVMARLKLSVPLEASVTMDDIGIHAQANLEGVHLGAVVAGRDLDRGALALDATAQGLTLTGQATLAGIPSNVNASMDFRAGGSSQVLQRITVDARPTARELAAAGLDLGPALEGPVGLAATLTERRGGEGDIAITADLTQATLAAPPIGWRKPAEVAARATASLRLTHDRLVAIDDIAIEGDGVAASASATCVDGKPAVIQLSRLALGRTEGHGTIRLPGAGAGAGSLTAITLAGPSLDLSGRLTRRRTERAPKGKPEEPSGPHWTLDARFDQVIMAADRRVTGVSAELESNQGLIRRLRVDGLSGPKAPFNLRINSAQGKRTFTATAANAGEFLAAFDVSTRIEGGTLAFTGSYNDTRPDHPLEGAAEIDDFQVRDAPVLARLLQAMTLYGLVDALRGPGLGFSRLVAPFQLSDDTLTLTGARAFSPSLGLTAQGEIDLDLRRANLDGTIVPAYLFNSMLGNVPLVGRLFSPERGGGVFAASYTVRGSLDDPAVSVNPLSALTPGFLRGLFGLF